MKGVDKINQSISYCMNTNTTVKWWKRVLFHLVEIGMNNAFIIYKNSPQNKLSSLEFRKVIIKRLINSDKFFSTEDNININTKFNPNLPVENIKNIHKLQRVDKQLNKGRCRQCSKTIKYYCTDCSKSQDRIIYLHPECFNEYHEDNNIYLNI